MAEESSSIGKISGRLMFRSLLGFAIIIAVIFISAGGLDYWQGWAFTGLNLIFVILSYLLLPPELIQERLKPEKGMKKWDKIYYLVNVPIFFVIIIISALDAGRFTWYPQIPFYISVIGILAYTIGHLLILWAKMVNNYFSSVVRIQKDRGQTICKEGPYSFVRHPGYLGGSIYTLATPLVLASFWGLIPAVISLILLLIRTSLEDKTLKKELEGYIEYTNDVRYKILPGIF